MFNEYDIGSVNHIFIWSVTAQYVLREVYESFIPKGHGNCSHELLKIISG